MNEILEEVLQIRFVELKFHIEFLEDVCLPKNKVSALRGGMGNMLLAQNCIRDQVCESCDFETECLVCRTMYSKYEIQPKFAKRGDSIGYVIECENLQENFHSGERLEFRLLLFGKTIVYFSQFLQAFYMLGQAGLGNEKARYAICDVKNYRNEYIVKDYIADLQKLGIRTIADYVRERMQSIQQDSGIYRMVFQTPATIKYKGEFIQAFQSDAVFQSILRRIYSFNCFEGNIVSDAFMQMQAPKMEWQEARLIKVCRYSSTAKSKMELKGIVGKMDLVELTEDQLVILLAGEKLHIGKNTSFGFGRYSLKCKE